MYGRMFTGRIYVACEKIEEWANVKNAKYKQCRNFMGKVFCLLFDIWGFFQEDYLTA